MIIFLYGTDSWHKKQKIEQIKQDFVKEFDPSRLNLGVFDFDEIDEDNIRSTILASPFMAAKRMVLVKNLLTKSKKKDVLEALAEVLKEIKDSTILVLSEDGPKPKKWPNQTIKKIWEYLEKSAAVEVFDSWWGAKLEAAIIKQAKEYKLEFSQDAAAFLSMLSGGDFGRINQELQKLSAFCENGKVEIEDVKKLCAGTSEANIFDFLDSLGNRDRKNLLNKFEDQLKEDDPVALVARATGHIRAMLFMKMKGQEGAESLQLHPFQAKKISSQIHHWEIPVLKSFLFKLMVLDYSMKSGRAGEPKAQLAALFARLG